MKKTVLLFMMLFASIVLIFAQNVRNVTYDGVTYQIVNTADDFLTAYRDSRSAALIFRINDYQRTMLNIRNEGERLNIDISQAFAPHIVVRAANLQIYTTMEVFSLLQGGTVSPNVDAYVFNKARPSSGVTSRSESANNLKAYFKHLSGLWWTLLNTSERNSKICDSCRKGISYGNGYIYGFYDNVILRAWQLWCDDCMEDYLERYRTNGLAVEGGFFEAEDVRRANEYANESR